MLKGQTSDFCQAGFLRLGIEAGPVFAEFLLQCLIDDAVLRRYLGGGFTGDLPTDLPCIDCGDLDTRVLEEPGGRDANDASTNNRDLNAEIPGKLGEIGRLRGSVPVASTLRLVGHDTFSDLLYDRSRQKFPI